MRTIARYVVPGALALAMVALPTRALAGTYGAEQDVSGGTTPAVGSADVAASSDGSHYLVVWEASRTTTGAQAGVQKVVEGQLIDALTGAKIGTPQQLAGQTGSDANLDAVDPAVASLSDGSFALVWSQDAIDDAGTTDTTQFRVDYRTVSADLTTLGTPVQVSTPPNPSDTGWDARQPDVAIAGDGTADIAYQAPEDATDNGTTIWRSSVTGDTASATPVVVGHTTGTSAPSDAHPHLAIDNGPVVTFQGHTQVDVNGDPITRVYVNAGGGAVLLSSNDSDPAREDRSPAIATDGSGYLVTWSGDVGAASAGDTQIWGQLLTGAGAANGAPRVLTSGNHATLPGVAVDPQTDEWLVSYVERNTSSHHEVRSERLTLPDTGPASIVENVQDSATDGSTLAANAEPASTAVAAAGASRSAYVVWGRELESATQMVGGRMLVQDSALFVTSDVVPDRAAPPQTGINPADDVTVRLRYGNAATREIDGISLTMALPSGFTLTGSPSYQDCPGAATPTQVAPTAGGALQWTLPSLGSCPASANAWIELHGHLDAGVAEGAVKQFTADFSTSFPYDQLTPGPSTDTLTAHYPPYVTGITRLDSPFTNASSVQWKVTFSEPVTGVDTGDFTSPAAPPGVSITGVTGSGSEWTVTASTGTATTGTVRMRVPDTATAQDSVGFDLASGNLPLSALPYYIDRTSPQVSLSSRSAASNQLAIPFDMSSDEALHGLSASDLTVTNGSVSSLRVTSSTSWVVTARPSADGTVTLQLPAGATVDRAGNPNTASNVASTISDRTRPVLTVEGPAGPTGADPLVFQISSSEPVFGLTTSDLSVLGTAGSGAQVVLNQVDDQDWTATVTGMTANGQVVVQVPAGAGTDLAGNANATAQGSTAWRTPAIRLAPAVPSTSGDQWALGLEVYAPGDVTFTYASSNEALVPVGNLAVVGTGSDRALDLQITSDLPGTSIVDVSMVTDSGTVHLPLQVTVGGSGDDTLTGTRPDNLLIGGDGNDTLTGAAGRDVLVGGPGDDVLSGGAGRDVLVGGSGADTLTGGTQGDLFATDSSDTLTDFSSDDTQVAG